MCAYDKYACVYTPVYVELMWGVNSYSASGSDVHVCIRTCGYIHICKNIHACVYAPVYVELKWGVNSYSASVSDVHVSICTCEYIHICKNIHACVCMHPRTWN